MNDLTRRDALVIAGACACCAMSADGVFADDKAPTTKPKSVAIGKPADYPTAGFYDKFAKQKVMVRRLDDRLVAMTTVCTHKGCAVKPQADKQTLKCPCHKAEFSEEGTPTAGPARTALDRYAIQQAEDGTITVDTTKTFIESKWENADAFIPLPKKSPAGG